MAERRYFGTDGIRGRVGEYPITPDFVLKLGWAVGQAFKSADGQRGRVVVGKDTRISGYMFESVLEAGFAAAGMDVMLLGPMPTPAIAYLTRTFRASAGVVISASHNPHYDNGIKFFGADGCKLPDEVEAEIEAWMDRPMVVAEPAHLGKAVRVDDAKGRYIEFCKSGVPFWLSLERLNIVIDCAQGATYHVAPSVFRELGATVHAIGIRPNGVNINDACGSTSPEALVAAVLEQEADVGIAFDGDGDRVIMVDHKGEIIDGDEILFIIARHKQRQGRLGGGVVGTLMTNFGAELAFRELGIPFERAKVGDRYVMEMLGQKGWLLGGEGSGHIVCKDVTTTGDGIVSALQVLVAMVQEGASLHDLKRGMSKLPQTMINVRMKTRQDVSAHADVQEAVARATERLGQEGRVLLRPSGTEPVIRVMVEGVDENLVGQIAQELADQVQACLA